MVKFDCDPGLVLFKKRLNTIWEASEIKLKESDRLCKVVELSMQCCGKLLSDSFETFVFIIILNFLFFWIYTQISSNSSNVVFSIIILENLQKSLWIMRNQNNEKILTNNWTRELIFDDKINFYFLNMFLYMTSVVYLRTFLQFMSSLFSN